MACLSVLHVYCCPPALRQSTILQAVAAESSGEAGEDQLTKETGHFFFSGSHSVPLLPKMPCGHTIRENRARFL